MCYRAYLKNDRSKHVDSGTSCLCRLLLLEITIEEVVLEIGQFERPGHIAGTLLLIEEAIQSHFNHLGTPSTMAVGVEQEQRNVRLPMDIQNQHGGIYTRIGLLVPALNESITSCPKTEPSVLMVILGLAVSGMHCRSTNEGRLITHKVSIDKIPSRGQILRFDAKLGVLVESSRGIVRT